MEVMSSVGDYIQNCFKVGGLYRIDVKPNYVIIKKNSIHIIQPYQEVHFRIGIYAIDMHMMSIFQRRREDLPLI